MARDIPKKCSVWPPSGFHGGLWVLFKGFAGPKTDQNLSPSRKKIQPNLFGLDLIYEPILGCFGPVKPLKSTRNRHTKLLVLKSYPQEADAKSDSGSVLLMRHNQQGSNMVAPNEGYQHARPHVPKFSEVYFTFGKHRDRHGEHHSRPNFWGLNQGPQGPNPVVDRIKLQKLYKLHKLYVLMLISFENHHWDSWDLPPVDQTWQLEIHELNGTL